MLGRGIRLCGLAVLAAASPLLPRDALDAAQLDKRQSSSSAYPANTIDMPIDHFPDSDRYAPHDNGTFKQRYYVDSSYYKEGGPVFLYIGGETSGPSRFSNLQTGIIQILMEATNGLGVILENRYYGQSYPYPNSTNENLRYLTTEQTIADNAYFAQHATFPMLNTTKSLNAPGTPWILYGGSLAGAQTAFSVKTYPDILYGGIGSSATTNAVLGFAAWFAPIQRYAPPDCVASVEGIVDKFDSLIKSNNSQGIAELKNLFGLANLTDLRDFAQTIAFPLGSPTFYPGNTWQELNWNPDYSSSDFWQFCQNVTNINAQENVTAIDTALSKYTNGDAWTNLGNYVSYIKDFYIPTYCPDGNVDTTACFSTQNESYWADITNSGTRSYLWSACTEQGTYVQAPAFGPSLISRVLQPDYTQQWCTYAFGDGVPDTPDLNEYNKYGGYSVEADRLAHIDGSIDPWLDICYNSEYAPARTSSDLRPNLVISGGGHHWDSTGIKNVSAEPDFIQQAHLFEIRFVQKWLRDFPNWDPSL